MSFFNSLFGKKDDTPQRMIERFIPYGKNTLDGDHDHRTNKAGDRTPAQKAGDKKRRKE